MLEVYVEIQIDLTALCMQPLERVEKNLNDMTVPICPEMNISSM
jgi:hypothetical protein